MDARKKSKRNLDLPEPYASKVEEATRMAQKAFKKYGEPTMTLEELREMVDRELGDISLGDYVVEMRKSGY